MYLTKSLNDSRHLLETDGDLVVPYFSTSTTVTLCFNYVSNCEIRWKNYQSGLARKQNSPTSYGGRCQNVAVTELQHPRSGAKTPLYKCFVNRRAISSTLDKVRFSETEKLKASTGRSSIAENEPKILENNTTILNVFRRGWALPNRKITRFSYKQELYIYNIFMKGEQSGVKYSPENTAEEMREQIDPTGRKLFQPFECMTSSQIRSLFSRMPVLHKGGTLKPPSPDLELADDINEDLDDTAE
ncbi:hypothetical protein AVEN_198316-1 [Araneus ventricosus]|uniref:Uncharacterized protein n=1 Tax=Araneus ventricosus TaxID=182803 RepID=A0A4Y2JZ84_ARAVE|nr:hypothetical protein AVEN_198316-1 [Araneus ventricosus]